MTLALAAPTAADVQEYRVTVCATDSTGANIVLGQNQAWLAVGSSHYVGQDIGYPVDANGCRYEDVNDGTTVEVWVAKDGTSSQHKSATITADKTFNFYTTKVTIQYPGRGRAIGDNTLDYGKPSSTRWFQRPSMELFANSAAGHALRFGLKDTGGPTAYIDLTWPNATGTGETFTRSLVALRLIDSNGDPLDGGKARYKTGSWHYAPGATGDEAPGILAYALNGLVGNLTNEMKFNNTIQTLTQNAASNSVYKFQTREMSLRLATNNGVGLQGGKARYGRGAKYGTWWWPGGTTDSNGYSKAEIFPGTYSFQMLYKGTAEVKSNVNMPDSDKVLPWRTTRVKLYYSEKISYGGKIGDARWFNKPAMDLLAGTYKFHFRSGPTIDLTWGPNDTYTKSMVVAKVKNSSGSPVQGAKAEVAPGGSWLSMGNTDADGVAYKLLNGGPVGNTKVRIGYHNTSETKTFDQPTHSIFNFATVEAVIKLLDDVGNGLPGGTIQKGNGSWILAGTTNANGVVRYEVFPGTWDFRVFEYNGNTNQKTQDVSTQVVFQTGSVVSDTGTATRCGIGSWVPYTSGMQLLPGNWHCQFNDGFPQTYYDFLPATVNHIH